jgi:hypothetical protein
MEPVKVSGPTAPDVPYAPDGTRATPVDVSANLYRIDNVTLMTEGIGHGGVVPDGAPDAERPVVAQLRNTTTTQAHRNRSSEHVGTWREVSCCDCVVLKASMGTRALNKAVCGRLSALFPKARPVGASFATKGPSVQIRSPPPPRTAPKRAVLVRSGV